MSSKKYAKDYKLIQSVTENGRVVTDMEYVGEYWSYVAGGEAARRAIRRATLVCGLSWLCFVLALLPKSRLMETWYVLFPFLFCALPLWLLSAALLRLYRCGEHLPHREADLAENRIPACARILILLPALAVVGGAFWIVARHGKPEVAGDTLFFLWSLLLLGCGLYLHCQSRFLRTMKSAE